MAPNIIVSRPTFPTYLLPSFNIPFRRHSTVTSLNPSAPASDSAPTPAASQVPSLSSSPTSSTTDETATPPNSPPPSYRDATTTTTATDVRLATAKSATAVGGLYLARTQPDTLRCSTCSCDIAFSSQIVSKGFTGRYGRAYLVAPTPPPPAPISGGAPAPEAGANAAAAGPGSLANVRIGRCENRQLVTGWHVVADITCILCSAKLGWKYVDAKELSQKYKVGKFILEVERVVPFRSWEDVPSPGGRGGVAGDDVVEEEEEGEEESERESDGVRGDEDDEGVEDGGRREGGDADAASGAAKGGEPRSEDIEIVFDSEDEDELEDLFAGTWDPEVVAKRRGRRGTAARKNQ
ncbi:Yippee -like protein [Colletotrichum tanaceti]|uniref:Yippee-like protein n=1 Tax=Colletotrichum tanaceti TaxID=1306861 RepID=A0A4U6XBB1_9PEZI|nr:Yippee -like protein [Colletotrichum tanaceti]